MYIRPRGQKGHPARVWELDARIEEEVATAAAWDNAVVVAAPGPQRQLHARKRSEKHLLKRQFEKGMFASQRGD